MKFTAEQFAKALVSVYMAPGSSKNEILHRAAELLKENGALRRVPRVLLALEYAWQKKTQAKKVTIESALPLSATEKEKCRQLSKVTDKDVLEFQVKSELIAGVIVRENEARMLDFSFRSRIKRLFSHA